MPPTADNGASLLDAELVLPRLREADPDEDAVTLAAEAALPVLGAPPSGRTHSCSRRPSRRTTRAGTSSRSPSCSGWRGRSSPSS